jgi:hypothetical protein
MGPPYKCLVVALGKYSKEKKRAKKKKKNRVIKHYVNFTLRILSFLALIE